MEKILLRTRRPADMREIVERDDALGGLLRSVRTLAEDEAGLASLAKEFSELRSRLPLEIFDAETLDPTAPLSIRGLLGDIEELLLGKLLSTKEGREL
jgi:hypothetical protein